VSNVVPDVSEVVVSSDTKCRHEAVERHVILLGVEATQADVVVELGVLDTHLQQPPDTPHPSTLLHGEPEKLRPLFQRQIVKMSQSICMTSIN